MVKGKAFNVIAEMFVWTVLGCFVEILVTATVERLSLGSDYVLAGSPWYSLQGHTTLWNIVNGVALTFGIRVLLRLFHEHRVFRNAWARGLVTIPLIYTLEFLGGLLFNKLLGMNLWDYSQYVWHGVPLHLMGQITLVYAPFWFLAGVFLPTVYRAVHSTAPYVGTQFEHILGISPS
jgi:putative ABC transporter type IV